MGRAEVYTLVGETLYAPGDMLPGSPASKAEPKQSPGDPDGSGDPDVDTGYLGWTLKELKAEIAQRNAERDEDAHLSAKGNKAALVAVLEADDASSDDPGDPDGSGDPDDQVPGGDSTEPV